MVLFEWDESKASINLRKHSVRFEDAMLVFSDPFALVEQDRITVQTEAEDETIRIISARKATRKEQERYDENRAKEVSL